MFLDHYLGLYLIAVMQTVMFKDAFSLPPGVMPYKTLMSTIDDFLTDTTIKNFTEDFNILSK